MSPSNDRATIEQRIAKLLAQAEGTNHPEEAATASAAAERLMLKWGIDEAIARSHLAGGQAKAEQVVKQVLKFSGTYAQAEIVVASYVCHGLGNLSTVQTRYDARGREVVFSVIGYESEVDHAVQLVRSLQVQLRLELARWWRTTPERAFLSTAMEKFKARRQFMHSYGAVVYDRLSKQRAALVEETGDTNGTELALRDRKVQVDEATARFFPHLRTMNSHVKGSYFGGAAGRQAGASADLGGGRKLGTGPRRLGR